MVEIWFYFRAGWARKSRNKHGGVGQNEMEGKVHLVGGLEHRENHWKTMENHGKIVIYLEHRHFLVSKSTTGWWFGTMEFYDFAYMGNSNPN